MSVLILFVLLSECALGQDVGSSIEVGTVDGVVRGYKKGNINYFRGIPYAAVDENNPFADARPYPHFDQPYAATDDSVICPQYSNGIKGSIQCLRVNVYTPQNALPGQDLPTMVFLHGGGFYEGSGSLKDWAPNFLIKHNVILVTVNYRLGPYGNLCIPNTKYNNQGLKDQVLALKWVKRNIVKFGGDVNNIVLFGHSAGSVSADIHLLYNRENLFNKVILQSGQAVSPLITDATPYKTYAKDIGMSDENIDIDRFIEKLASINVNTFINNTKHYIFRPCIDGDFITNAPPTKNMQNIQIIVGDTDKETLFFYRDVTSFQSFDLSTDLRQAFTDSVVNVKNIDEIKERYELNQENEDRLKDLTIDFGSDLFFNFPTVRSIRYYLQNNATVYRYVFKYDGDRNFVKKRDHLTWPGATHGDELGYLFDIMSSNKITDLHVVDWICLLWTNFAFGNPTPPPWSPELPVTWPRTTAATDRYLQIDRELIILDGPYTDRLAFWDSFYGQHGQAARGSVWGSSGGLDLCRIFILRPNTQKLLNYKL